MSARVLVLAQGTGRRWDLGGVPFLDAPKHLCEIDGETLLGRARRLFAEQGCEVIVVGPQEPGYTPCVTLDDPFPTGTEQDKFLGTRHLWSDTERTIIAWGDVWYSAEAVRTIVENPSSRLHYFRRPRASAITGHRWDESFAVSFSPADHDRVVELAKLVAAEVQAGRVKKDHIRTHYAAHLGLPLDNASLLVSTPDQTVIDDWTDDFDRPDEWARWVGRRYAGKVPTVVCIPWRRCDFWRSRARTAVHDHYAAMGVPVVYGSADGDMFNRSAARNAAADDALRLHPETRVLFFADSDTLVSAEQFWSSVYLAHQRDELVVAFDTYVRTPQNVVQGFYSGCSALSGAPYRHHASGALAVPLGVWRDTGGYDERFGSWGGEDRSFYHVCNTLRGRRHALRVPGEAYHLWHPLSPERNERLPEYQANIALGVRYKIAAGRLARTGHLPAVMDGRDVPGDPAAIRAILHEPGGPLHPETSRAGRAAVQEDFVVPDSETYRNSMGRIVVVERGSDKARSLAASRRWERVQ